MGKLSISAHHPTKPPPTPGWGEKNHPLAASPLRNEPRRTPLQDREIQESHASSFSAVEGWFAAAAACKARYTARLLPGRVRQPLISTGAGQPIGFATMWGRHECWGRRLDPPWFGPVAVAANPSRQKQPLAVAPIRTARTTRATPAKCPGRWASSRPGWVATRGRLGRWH